MARLPHLPEVLKGPLAARPPAEQTPDWVWYFAWDDDGGAFYRPTPSGWVKATPSVGPVSWEEATLESDWTALSGQPLQYRRSNGTVELRGGVSRARGGFPSIVTTLPTGLRPGSERWFPVVVSGGLSSVSIGTDGAVTVYKLAPISSPNRSCFFDGVQLTLDEPSSRDGGTNSGSAR